MPREEKHMLNEADIGSGERTPGQQDTEKIIEQIGKDRSRAAPNDQTGGKRKPEQNDEAGK